MVAVLVMVAMLAVMAGAGLTFNQAAKYEAVSTRDRHRALYLAESGVNEALSNLNAALAQALTVDSTKVQAGKKSAPRKRRTGDYWTDVQDNGDGTLTITSTGEANGALRSVQAVMILKGGVWNNAIFAGNSSGDPTYTLELGGTGDQADLIEGDIFSGGNLDVSGDASITGAAGAAGVVTGTSGEEGVSQPVPDIAGMNYETNHDYDVASLFSTATWQADDAGGSAWQLPANSPAHIFRKNPSDRNGVNSGTVKDDYYIEDPYETPSVDPLMDGSDPYLISLAGTTGTDKVFYIDGNLWLHNYVTYSFRFVNANNQPVRVTFVVKGNITFSDNIYYNNSEKDGVAFVAIKDPAVADSGNIYFGDPGGGTLEYMDAFMYAENDFIDYNLDAAGSKNVTVNGIMSAGNQVRIERDYTMGDGTTSHSQLVVKFDDRIRTGQISLPGLPKNGSGSGGGGEYAMASWREVTAR